MKKKMLGIFLCTALAVTMAAGCTKKNEVLESSQAAAAAEEGGIARARIYEYGHGVQFWYSSCNVRFFS